MKYLLMVIILFVSNVSFTHALENPKFEKGQWELGIRSSLSLFGNDNNSSGMGYGGQFRLRFSERINTEWFADYFTTNIADIGNRKDYHIGWAVQFYPLKTNISLQPYFLAGHCFDYTTVVNNQTIVIPEIPQSQSRFTTAVHMGVGTQYYFHPNFNISLSALYMNHLGKDIDTEIVYDPQGDSYLRMTEKNWSLEGHVLVCLSLNYQIADLW